MLRAAVAHQQTMKDHSAYDYEVAEFIETAAAQLQEYGDMGLCDPTDREQVLQLAEESGHRDLANAANSPAGFGLILGETTHYPAPDDDPLPEKAH